MQRRQFLQLSAFIAAGSMTPFLAAKHPPVSRPWLIIPPLLEANAKQQLTLIAAAGSTQWQGKSVPTWGYNGALLGPTLRFKRGQSVNVKFYNQLNESTTLHWHGLVVPGYVDGGPHASVAPRQHRDISFRVDQAAATCWYHPHPHGRSGYQVAQGLAGMIIIEDEISGSLALPTQWGVDDISVILQDKQLNTAGTRIDYQLDELHAALGWFGQQIFTNGAVSPQHAVPRGFIRLRLLNACNARSLLLTTHDNRPIYVIASDGGFLTEPVVLEQIELLPGERFEVLLDTSDGKPLDLLSIPILSQGMAPPPLSEPRSVLRLVPVRVARGAQLPDSLVSLMPLANASGLTRRTFKLAMDPQLDKAAMHILKQQNKATMTENSMDPHRGQHAEKVKHPDPSSYDYLQANTINGQPFDMHSIAFQAALNKPEIWSISGKGDMMRHPFHIHGTQYRIISENGKAVAKHRQGLKDTVNVEGAESQVMVQFPHRADKHNPYMAHCHILEHEDTGMMLNFTVG